MNGKALVIELVTARLSAATAAGPVRSSLVHMLLSTAVSGIRANHYLQQAVDGTVSASYDPLGGGDRPYSLTYPIRAYADAGSQITFSAGVSGDGELEWTLSGRVVNAGC